MDETPKKPRPKAFDLNYNRSKRSKKQEDRFAKGLNGRRLPRSGGLAWSAWDSKWSAKKRAKTADGDIQTKDFLVEHKRTDAGSISVKLEWISKVREGSRSVLKYPALGLTFTDKQDRVLEEWVAVPFEVFVRLLMKMEEE